MTDKEAMAMALEALEYIDDGANNQGAHIGISWRCVSTKANPAIAALKERLADPMREVQRLGQEIEQDHAYGYASRLAVAIWQKHYMKDAPKWKPLDTTEGVLTQIDNMTCGLVKEKPIQPEQEPVAILNHAHGVHTFRNVKLKGLPDGEYLVYTHQPQRTEPVIDKSAAIRIATALGWTPPRTWVGLTDTDIGDEYVRLEVTKGGFNRFEYAVKAIEAKLKEKNCG
jgi:hypothetical protein